MVLEHLSIVNYKNISQAELDFSGKINCLIGMNGQGKTNLLDAIYFLSLCKSASCSQDSLNILHGQDMMMLQGRYHHEDGTPEDIHCGLKRGQKKVMRRGQKAYRKLSEHIGLIPLVMVSPADQQLIDGGSEQRRRFMDMVISQCDPVYLESLVRYNKALMQRNAMLKAEQEPDTELMELWEEEMAREGTLIHERRTAFTVAFEPVFQRFHDRISRGNERVGLTYVSHGQRGPLLEIIRQGRPKDRIMGFSLHGTHKDDLDMTIGGYPMKREGSQGQNKTYLIALKLAQFDYLHRTKESTTPLLLLDDIFDKLDAERVEQIVELVGGDTFGQIFITDTNRDHLDSILSHSREDYKLFHVAQGQINP
ncbi:MAG: DNA replication/repair protein RecF [Bacteroidaceae bacterium]